MYVPAGWWHAVLNLDATVAVTHNYASTANFPAVWRHTKRGRPKMSARWLAALREERPDLAAVAGAGGLRLWLCGSGCLLLCAILMSWRACPHAAVAGRCVMSCSGSRAGWATHPAGLKPHTSSQPPALCCLLPDARRPTGGRWQRPGGQLQQQQQQQ